MAIIKKYPNRRLYDTGASRYVNLDQIAATIRAGEDVEVVDAASGADLTRETLLAVVLETLHGADFFPVGMLHRVIRVSGDVPWERAARQHLATTLDLASRQLDRMEQVLRPPGGRSPAPKASARDAAPAPDDGSTEASSTPHAPAPDDELADLRERLAGLEARLGRGGAGRARRGRRSG